MKILLVRMSSMGDIFHIYPAISDLKQHHPDAELLEGYSGILEPLPERDAVTPDIVLVPLLGFDDQCHRIGYGAGHYDRTFSFFKKLR